MGYFDGLTSGGFKTAQDGRRFFFPWGIFGRGYAIASERDYLRLRQQVKAYMVATLVLVIASGIYDPYLAPLATGVLLVGFYLTWMWRVLPRLKRSDEKLSMRESMTSQAHAHGPVVLWLLEIGSIALFVASVVMMVFDPGSMLTGLACTVFFGFCTAKISRLLMLNYRTATTRL
ncbi:MAG: hypothetical protein ABI561_23520 [Bradyrhizobium sp.]